MVQCHLLHAGLVACMPLCSLSLSRNQKFLRLKWACECYHWCAEWQNVFSDYSHFNWSYSVGHIHVRCYCGDCNLTAFIVEQHSRQTPSVMVWGTIWYIRWSHLLYIEDNLNSNCYIREVLEPKVLPLLQRTPHVIFQQDNAQPHVARNVQAFFEDQWVVLLSWSSHSPDMLPIKHIWDIVGWQLVHHASPATTFDALFVWVI